MGDMKIELSEFKRGLAARSLTRRQIHKALAAVGVATITMPIMSKLAAAKPSIEVATWEVYSKPETHAAFTKAYGASPAFQLFSDNEEALQKIRAGAIPTLVQPGSVMIHRFRDAGLLAPIDTSKLSNYGDLFPQLKNRPEMSDGKDVYAVPAAWGDSSIIYRRDLVPDYAGNDTWAILWDKKYAGRLATRDGMDSATIPASLLLGIKDPYNMSDEDIKRIRAKLVEQRPLLRFYWKSETDMEQAMASGEIVAAYGWNSSYATLKHQGVDVGYMTPKEGRLTWIDVTVRIKNGPGSEDEALAYIDAFISAEAGKFFIENDGFGSPNAKAYEIADAKKLSDQGLSDPAKTLEHGQFYKEFTPAVSEKINAMFEEVKAGM